MKLTDTQLVLLSGAAQREDGAVEIGPKLKGNAAQKVARQTAERALGRRNSGSGRPAGLAP